MITCIRRVGAGKQLKYAGQEDQRTEEHCSYMSRWAGLIRSKYIGQLIIGSHIQHFSSSFFFFRKYHQRRLWNQEKTTLISRKCYPSLKVHGITRHLQHRLPWNSVNTLFNSSWINSLAPSSGQIQIQNVCEVFINFGRALCSVQILAC